MSINPLMPLYEDLKQKIKQYEVQKQIEFDNALNELRKYRYPSRFENQYEGKIFQSKNSGPFQVTEYFNYDKIAIVFLNSGYQMFVRANNLSRGEVRDPYAVSIMGVGYIGVGPYRIDTTPFDRMIYSRWRGILDRCYVKREGRKFVNQEWHNYQYFAAWFYSEFYEIPYISIYDMAVDKDILFPRNEEYGPYKCLILPNFINSKIQLKEYDREQIRRFDEGTMTQFEILKLMKHKAQREEIIRSLADHYRDILPFHVYQAIKKYQMF